LGQSPWQASRGVRTALTGCPVLAEPVPMPDPTDPAAASRETDWNAAPAYVWTGMRARAVPRSVAPRLELLRGSDRQKAAAAENVLRLARGHAAHDMLLWGARGMGKSALVRAAVAAAQEAEPGRIALVQVATDAVTSLAELFAELESVDRGFVVFVDDLGFAPGDAAGPRHLRSWLDGGVEA